MEIPILIIVVNLLVLSASFIYIVNVAVFLRKSHERNQAILQEWKDVLKTERDFNQSTIEDLIEKLLDKS